MYKACSRCGKIHDAKYKCNVNRVYKGGDERRLRNTYAWAQKSQEIRARADSLCEVCRDNGRYVYKDLEVHHIEKVKDNPLRLLDNYNLVCLCVDCHKKADKGEIDSEYLEKLAGEREGKGLPPSQMAKS